MSDTPLPPSSPRPASDDLQFATVEPVVENVAPGRANSGRSCLVCRQPITATYFALGDKLLCPHCAAAVTAPPAGRKLGRLLKASLLGLGAGLVGALIWFVIRRVAHLEIGLVAILVGFMVGKAVRRGSANRGGRGYQVLAVLITYCCIAANYMPDIFEAALKAHREQRAATAQAKQADAGANDDNSPAGDPAAVANHVAAEKRPAGILETAIGVALLLAIVFGISLAAPFLAGVENLLGLLIIGFALWEAWRLTAYQPLPISGPYQLGGRSAS